MLLCGFYSDCTVPLKSKLPVVSRFLCDENRIARESSNQKANFNTQQSTCRRGKTVFAC